MNPFSRRARRERMDRHVNEWKQRMDEQAVKDREAHALLTEKAARACRWERSVRQPDFSSTLYSQVGFADWRLTTIKIGNGESEVLSANAEAAVCPCCFALVLADQKEGDFRWAHARWHHERGHAPVPKDLLADTWF